VRSLESICFALKQRRLDQGLTQLDLARKACVSRAWLIGLESGKATRAEFGKIIDVAHALGLEFDLKQSNKLSADEEAIMGMILNA